MHFPETKRKSFGGHVSKEFKLQTGRGEVISVLTVIQ